MYSIQSDFITAILWNSKHISLTAENLTLQKQVKITGRGYLWQNQFKNEGHIKPVKLKVDLKEVKNLSC
jgi:hypothetical protein